MNDNDASGPARGSSEQPPPWGPQQPPPAPRRSRSVKGVLTHTAAAVLGLIIGAVIGSGGADDSDSKGKDTAPSAMVTVTRTATETESAPPAEETPTPTPNPTRKAPDGEIPGDGTYIVGDDIRPGTYRTDGPEESVIPNCYWARLSGTSGEFDEIIANANTAGPTTVTISASDGAFQTTGCKTWKRTG
ncbi:hypothetical protein K4B79_03535 [Streptomyces lincolnensis]|uniref:hypothetical protein n=1 Tax=Streptomyces lincolnensis TaxID=1915 RepID=UPI001E5BC958|nr:hypothetical protein [Streptomyces lincolnensis]MCD7437291.1 hypothetical protein [Streptomyces lincolnensis]